MTINSKFNKKIEPLINSSKDLTKWFERNQEMMLKYGFTEPNCTLFLTENIDQDIVVLGSMAEELLFWLDEESDLTDEEAIKMAIKKMTGIYEKHKDSLSPEAKEKYAIGHIIKKTIERSNLVEPVLKNKYDVEGRKEIQSLCRNFSRYSFPRDISIVDKVKEETIRPYFLKSLDVFDSSLITDYFSERTKNLKIIRDKNCTSEEIKLHYKISEGRPMSLKLIVPDKKLTMNDQVGYAHEVGHIPGIEFTNEIYVEYGEVLPMFLEFITDVRRTARINDAFDKFLFSRLPLEQSAARDILKMFKELGFSKTKITNNQREIIGQWYSFLESLEYTIQLINAFNDDRASVTNEIEGLLTGKTLVDVADNLGINTEDCKMLQKEYKRIGRM